jgi:hypothetical protein
VLANKNCLGWFFLAHFFFPKFLFSFFGIRFLLKIAKNAKAFPLSLFHTLIPISSSVQKILSKKKQSIVCAQMENV